MCHKIFRTHILKANTIGIVTQDGYAGRKKQQSKKALQWMAWIAHKNNVTITNASSMQGEVKVGQHFVDGICHANKTIFEFHGCYFHGCPKCYSPRFENRRTGCYMGDAYSSTLDKDSYLRGTAPDHELVTMWECDFDRAIKVDKEMATFINNLRDHRPSQPAGCILRWQDARIMPLQKSGGRGSYSLLRLRIPLPHHQQVRDDAGGTSGGRVPTNVLETPVLRTY